MNATRKRIDWTQVRQQLALHQTLLDDSQPVDRDHFSKVLHERAEKLARRGQRKALQDATAAVLAFRVGNERFGIELSHVEQVFSTVAITAVPGAADHLLGVANLQGKVRSVFNVRRLVGLPAEPARGGYVVLIRADGALAGLWVEALDKIGHVAVGSLAALETAPADTPNCLLKGRTEDGLIVLDPAALLQHVAGRNRNQSGGM